MQSLTHICNETGLNLDDARLILINVREDWAIAEEVTDGEANLIKQSTYAALPESNGSITPVAGMSIDQQERLIDNASQVLGFPLVLSALQEIKALDTLEQVKNAIALNVIDKRQAELDAAIKERSEARQQAYVTAISDLANQMQKPVEVVAEMKSNIDATNARLAALLAQVQTGK
jgi:hypothetical protein